MSSSSPPKEKDLDILPELPLHHDQSKSGKRESLAPQSLPARNSSLQSSRQQGNTSETVPVPISKDNMSQNDDEKPPTPPPKPQRRRQPSAPKEGTVEPVKQNKAGLFARIMIALATCCQPSTAGVESRPRRVKEPLEMETMRKDLPTTSKPNEKDSEAAKLRVMEDTRPSVTIAPDAQTQKEPNGQARIVTPALLPVHHEDEDDEAEGTISTDEETKDRERALRESISIQAPFPPTQDELQQSEAVVVSPAPQISLSSTESEDSETEETIPRQLNQIVDEPQPRV